MGRTFKSLRWCPICRPGRGCSDLFGETTSSSLLKSRLPRAVAPEPLRLQGSQPTLTTLCIGFCPPPLQATATFPPPPPPSGKAHAHCEGRSAPHFPAKYTSHNPNRPDHPLGAGGSGGGADRPEAGRSLPNCPVCVPMVEFVLGDVLGFPVKVGPLSRLGPILSSVPTVVPSGQADRWFSPAETRPLGRSETAESEGQTAHACAEAQHGGGSR